MKLPKPFLGRAVIEAIQDSSVDYLKEKLKERVGADVLERGKAAGLILDDPEIFRTVEQEFTGRVERNEITGEYVRETVSKLGKSIAENKVPLYRGKILDMAPDFCGARFQDLNPDAGYTPTIGDIIWFVPNETMAIDPNKKYHLINDCDIVAYESGE